MAANVLWVVLNYISYQYNLFYLLWRNHGFEPAHLSNRVGQEQDSLSRSGLYSFDNFAHVLFRHSSDSDSANWQNTSDHEDLIAGSENSPVPVEKSKTY